MSGSNPIIQMQGPMGNQVFDYRPGRKYLIVWRVNEYVASDAAIREELRGKLYEAYEFLGVQTGDIQIIFVDENTQPLTIVELQK